MRVFGLCMMAAVLFVAPPVPTFAAGKPAAGRASLKPGSPGDPGYFPIAVWLQDPVNARRYEAAGINLYIGLWQGPTEPQLAALKSAGMRVFCEPNDVGRAHRSDPTIAGWMHQDEPDNAQSVRDPATGKESYGPPVPPSRIVEEYRQFHRNDPSRPVMLNLGQGVANDAWMGRGSGARPDDYLTYVKGADIVSFDVYPVAGLGPDGADRLWYVARGVDRLIKWSGGRKAIWNCIECTHIGDANLQATPHQVRAEVWMSLIHGSRGLIYFVHQFQPKFDEHALLDDPTMLPAVTKINQQIHQLAPVLNAPAPSETVSVASSSTAVPIDAMIRRFHGSTYLFAVGMRNAPATGRFALSGLTRNATAEVIGEGRTLPVVQGRLTDGFKPYDVHLYRIR